MGHILVVELNLNGLRVLENFRAKLTREGSSSLAQIVEEDLPHTLWIFVSAVREPAFRIKPNYRGDPFSVSG